MSMTDYGKETTSFCSPKSSYTYPESIHTLKPRQMKKQIQDYEIIQHLKKFKFPKAYATSIIPNCSGDARSIEEEEEYESKFPSIVSKRRVSNASTTSSARQRVHSHRRSDAVSGGWSDESLFSNSPTEVLTRDTSINSTSLNLVTINPTRLDFSQYNTSNNVNTNFTPQPSPPIIDLDVVFQPLKPRLGSPLQDPPLGTISHTSSSVIEKSECYNQATYPGDELESNECDSQSDTDSESDSDECIGILDSLKETSNNASKAMPQGYNPFQYIHLNRSWWIQKTAYST